MDMCAAPGSKVMNKALLLLLLLFFYIYTIIDSSDFGGPSCTGHNNIDLGAFWTSSRKRQRLQADSFAYSPDCPTPKPGSHGYQSGCIQFPIYQSPGADNRRFSSGTPVI